MALDPITAILSVGNSLIDRLIPDKTQAAQAKATLVQMQIQGELDQMKGQLTVDAAEAANQSIFVAGWRPFIGWICGIALSVDFVIRPIFVWLTNLLHHPADFPVLDMTELMPLVLGMLGMTAAHAWEGVATKKANGDGDK